MAATGTLKNPDDVLTPAQRERLARAKTSETPIAIIGDEVGTDATRPETVGTQVWRFSADSVRDFAFAAAPNFRWDASGYDGILIHTFYRPSATRWPEANRMAREAVKYFSEQWMRYPYPQMSSVEGPIEGMEYPMLTFDPAGPSREELQWVVAHEIGHQWSPMVVGVNERLYPWMDEGFNTFIDLANSAKYFSGTPYGDSIEVHPLHLYADHAIAGQEQPLITRPVESRDLFWTGYQKPALMMQVLRFQVLGKEAFDPAFRDYLKTWAFKHPTPSDFFRIMRDNTGVELDWFWADWVYGTTRPDIAVEAIDNGEKGATVTLQNKGHDAAADPAAAHLCRRQRREREAARRGVEPRRYLRLPGQEREESGAGSGGPGHAAAGHRSHQQRQGTAVARRLSATRMSSRRAC